MLKWNERLNIAIDAANGISAYISIYDSLFSCSFLSYTKYSVGCHGFSGLQYLLNGCKPLIVHRDLKTSNILLDQSKHAKIADFCRSRAFGNDIDSHISTHLVGKPGYIDPE